MKIMRSVMYLTLFFFLLMSFWSVVTLQYMMAGCSVAVAVVINLMLNRFEYDNQE